MDTMEMIVTPSTPLAIPCVAEIWTLLDTMWVMTAMVQLLVTAISAVTTLLQIPTSTAAVNVISSGQDLPAKPMRPHATQSVMAALAVQHAIA